EGPLPKQGRPPIAIRASGASNQKLREQRETGQSARHRPSRCGRDSCSQRQRIDRLLGTGRAGCRAVHFGHIEGVDGLARERTDVSRSDRYLDLTERSAERIQQTTAVPCSALNHSRCLAGVTDQIYVGVRYRTTAVGAGLTALHRLQDAFFTGL